MPLKWSSTWSSLLPPTTRPLNEEIYVVVSGPLSALVGPVHLPPISVLPAPMAESTTAPPPGLGGRRAASWTSPTTTRRGYYVRENCNNPSRGNASERNSFKEGKFGRINRWTFFWFRRKTKWRQWSMFHSSEQKYLNVL